MFYCPVDLCLTQDKDSKLRTKQTLLTSVVISPPFVFVVCFGLSLPLSHSRNILSVCRVCVEVVRVVVVLVVLVVVVVVGGVYACVCAYARTCVCVCVCVCVCAVSYTHLTLPTLAVV